MENLKESGQMNDLNNELCHHGILGQKWGVRRYQNEDGSLTYRGKMRYIKDSERASKYYGVRKKEILNSKAYKEYKKLDDDYNFKRFNYGKYDKRTVAAANKLNDELKKNRDSINEARSKLSEIEKREIAINTFNAFLSRNGKLYSWERTEQVSNAIDLGKQVTDYYLKLENGDKNFYKKNQKATKKQLLKASPMLKGKGTEFKYDEYGRVTSARRSF